MQLRDMTTGVTLEAATTVDLEKSTTERVRSTCCFMCGMSASDNASFLVQGPNPLDHINLHPSCALRFAMRLLEQFEQSQTDTQNGNNGHGVDLSPRERQVLEGIVRGERDREIADRLGIAEHTVKNHAYDVRHKIGARSRTDAAVRAIRTGLVVEMRPPPKS